MAVSVRDFSRAHPSADASYASVLNRLEASITRMEELAGQQQGGYLSKHSRRCGARVFGAGCTAVYCGTW
jgi:hypothetical protein